MCSFYEITPLDTLFFRGSTPMEAGQYNTISLFPPPASVIKGALWTAHCSKNGKNFSDGLVGGEIPAEITGFFINKAGDNNKSKLYTPAPATWYYDCDEKKSRGADLKDIPLCIAKGTSKLFAAMNMKSSAGDVVFAVPKYDAKPLGGAWVSVEFLQNPKMQFEADSVLFAGDIYSLESRTGVGLTQDKKAEDGKLYTSTHIRLHDGISFVVSLESDIDFGEEKMNLGGEKRLAKYKAYKEGCSVFNGHDIGQFLSLMPVEATEEHLSALISSAKLTVTAGWDLAKGFHKPSVSWILAGAVFSKKINDSCVPLAHSKGE